MVVRPVERRAPVVHGVDEEIVQHDPAVLADDAAVIHDPGVLGPDPLVALCRRGGRPTGHPAADQERCGEAGIDQAGEQAHASEAARGAEHRATGPSVPAIELEPVHGLRHEPEIALLAGDGHLRGQPFQGQLAGRDHDLDRAADGREQHVARLDIALGRHREEVLSAGEADDRLVAPQELQIVGHACVDAGSCRKDAAIERTERWFR